MDIGQILSNRISDPSGRTNHLLETGLQTVSGNNEKKLEQLRAAAKHFEGIFIHQILKQMQETIENASFDPEDNAGKQVHSMYSTFMADAISQQGGFGMWEQIYDQLLQSQDLGQELESQSGQFDKKA
jgi:flagellar protein FlgJ